MDKERAALRASAILDDELFNDAFYAIEDQLIEQWKSSETTEEREAIFFELNALEKVRDKLKTHIYDHAMSNSDNQNEFDI